MTPKERFRRDFEAGYAHHTAGRLNLAEAKYRSILARHREHAPTLHLLAVIEHQRGNHDEAARLLRRAIRRSPETADFHANLGLIHLARKRPAEAAAALAKAVHLNPRHADALNNLGSALEALGRGAEAVDYYGRAVAVRPDFRLAHLNLAGALRSQGRLAEAAAAYTAVLALPPEDAMVHFQLALVLYELGKLSEAAVQYRRVIDLEPTCFAAHTNLGTTLRDLNQPEATLASYREAVRLCPDSAACHLNLATGLWLSGLVEEATAECRTALRLKPDLEEAYTALLFDLHYRLHPPAEVLATHCYWAEARTKHLVPEPRPAASSGRAPAGRLRVGLLSSDFHDHPIAYYLEPLLAAYDRTALEVTCYASVAHPDEFTDRLRALADRWRDCRTLSHAEAARQITADGIDVLIDLTSHTAGSRLPVLALKPASVQVSYLGYAGTTGLPAMDYRLTDGYADPPGLTEAQYTETLVRLPHTLACYAPPPCAPPVAELPALPPERQTWPRDLRTGAAVATVGVRIPKKREWPVATWQSRAVSAAQASPMGGLAPPTPVCHFLRSAWQACQRKRHLTVPERPAALTPVWRAAGPLSWGDRALRN